MQKKVIKLTVKKKEDKEKIAYILMVNGYKVWIEIDELMISPENDLVCFEMEEENAENKD